MESVSIQSHKMPTPTEKPRFSLFCLGLGPSDVHLWPPQRIQAFQLAMATKVEPPIAVLKNPRLQSTVPGFEGTDDLTVNRAVERIAGTARLGDGAVEPSNRIR
jgi:hypothetical protein